MFDVPASARGSLHWPVRTSAQEPGTAAPHSARVLAHLGAAVRSRVGRWRGTSRSFSIAPSPNAPCIFRCSTLSRVWRPTQVGGGAAVAAPGISPTSLAHPRRPLCPFALWPALPAAPVGRGSHDYYEHSVTVALAGDRPSRIPSLLDVRARRRCPVRPLEGGRSSSPTRWRVDAPADMTREPGGPAIDVVSRGHVLASLGAGVPAV
jgi:hypothetical protein